MEIDRIAIVEISFFMNMLFVDGKSKKRRFIIQSFLILIDNCNRVAHNAARLGRRPV